MAPGPEPAPVASPMRLAAVAWSTVDLDRAETELDMWLAPVVPAGAPAAPTAERDLREPLLGARARIRRPLGLPADLLVIAEPTTEGRLAASLARDGEGPCALYLWPATGLDAWLAGRRGGLARRVVDGPFGRSVLLTGVTAGPFVIVVERRDPGSPAPVPGTIPA